MSSFFRHRLAMHALLWTAGFVLSAATLNAGQRPGTQKPAAPRKTAPPAKVPPAPPAPPPSIAVAGLRIVAPGLGINGSEVHAFNDHPGTAIALAVQAAPGTAIVALDDDASRLDAITDDTGQSLLEDVDFGSFPKLTEDRSAGIIDVAVRARPAAGAASIAARGSVAATVASGSKPERLSGFRLEPGRTTRVGSVSLSVKEVTAGDEATELTLGLPRSLLNVIRDVRAFDTTGAAVETRRTSSGYFNEAATLQLELKTKEKSVTLELDVWQNVRQLQVPFNVTVGVGFAPAGRAPSPTAQAAAESAAERALAAADRTAAAAASPRSMAAAPGALPPVRAPEGPAPAAVIAAGAAAAPVLAPAPGEGAASVEAVVKQLRSSASAANARDLLAVIYPDDRATFAQGLATVCTFSVMAHLDDEKASAKAQADVDALFAKHKIKPPLLREPADIFKETNLQAFVADAMALLKKSVKKGESLANAMPIPSGSLEDVQVTGDSATARLGKDDVKFARVNGRWFIRVHQ